MSAAETGNGTRLLTIDEVARALQISRKTVYRMVRDGRLQGVRLGDGVSAPIRVVSTSLTAFVQDGYRRQLARQAP